MYLRNAKIKLSDLDFLVFSLTKTKYGEANQLDIIMDEFFIPELKVYPSI